MRLGDVTWPRNRLIEQRIQIKVDLLLSGQHGLEALLVSVQDLKAVSNFIGPELKLGCVPYQQVSW